MKLGEFITFIELQNKITKSFNVITTGKHDYKTLGKDPNAQYRLSRLIVSNDSYEAQIIFSASTVNSKITYKMLNCDIFIREDWLSSRSLFIKNANMHKIVEYILEKQ